MMDYITLVGASKPWITLAFYEISGFIDNIVYYFIGIIYQVFMAITSVNLFGAGNDFGNIVDRVYTVLGIAMLFVFAYNILLFIANPDHLTDKGEKSMPSLVKNLVISIALLAFLPMLFNYLYLIQKNVLASNVIGNIVLNDSSTSETESKLRGSNVALTIFQAFYHPVNEETGHAYSYQDCENEPVGSSMKEICTTYNKGIDDVKNGNQGIIKFMSDEKLKKGWRDGKLEYLIVFSTIAGGIALYLFILFAIDIGVRVAKLAVLQIISPVPVVMRIFKPKGGAFDRWGKELTKTYLELFIRLSFIFFVMLAISIVPSALKNAFTLTEAEGIIFLLSSVFVILGILAFAKQAPKYLETIFSFDHMELSIKKKLNDNELGKRATTAIGGGLSSMTSNFWKNRKDATGKHSWRRAVLGGAGGLVSGTRRGFKNGNVDIGNIGDAIEKTRSEATAGVNKGLQFMAHPMENMLGSGTERLESIQGFFGGAGRTAENLQQVTNLKNRMKEATDLFKPAFDGIDKAKEKALAEFSVGNEVKIAKRDGNGNVIYKDKYETQERVVDTGIIDPDTHKPITKTITERVKVGQEIEYVSSAQEINAHFNAEKNKILHGKFKNENYKSMFEGFGRNLIEEMEQTRNMIGEEEFKIIFNKTPNVKDISEFKALVNKAGSENFTEEDMQTYTAIQKQINELVIKQSGQKIAEAKKESK